MPNLNKVFLMGNLTRDPEIKYTPKGNAVAQFGLAINRVYMAGDEKREETTFVDVTFWGKAAETLGEYVKKGDPLMIEGRLKLDSWDDKQTGQKRSKLAVVGEEFQFLKSKSYDNSDEYNQERRPQQQQQRKPASKPMPKPPTDDDMPFDEEADVPF